MSRISIIGIIFHWTWVGGISHSLPPCTHAHRSPRHTIHTNGSSKIISFTPRLTFYPGVRRDPPISLRPRRSLSCCHRRIAKFHPVFTRGGKQSPCCHCNLPRGLSAACGHPRRSVRENQAIVGECRRFIYFLDLVSFVRKAVIVAGEWKEGGSVLRSGPMPGKGIKWNEMCGCNFILVVFHRKC